MKAHVSRAFAERRYGEIRLLALEAARRELAMADITADVRTLSSEALNLACAWPARLVTWPWAQMAIDYRRQHPNRFELAIWHGETLCAVGLGHPGKDYAGLHHLEGNPDRFHPLRGRVAAIAAIALRSYGVALGKREIRFVEPAPALIRFYCGPSLGFDLVTPYRQPPYSRRSI